jgi:hypothetical protein
MEIQTRIDSRDLDLEDADDKALWDELGENASDHPSDGVFLVLKSDFENYAIEYAEDTGALVVQVINPRTYKQEPYRMTDQWPCNHIDWEAAAEELAEDWFEVEYKGNTYLAR